MAELVEDGDEIVAIRVIELDEDGQCTVLVIHQIKADSAERHNPQQQDVFREQAHELLQDVLDRNNEADERKVSLRFLPDLDSELNELDICHCGICSRQSQRHVDEDDRAVSA